MRLFGTRWDDLDAEARALVATGTLTREEAAVVYAHVRAGCRTPQWLVERVRRREAGRFVPTSDAGAR